MKLYYKFLSALILFQVSLYPSPAADVAQEDEIFNEAIGLLQEAY